MLGTRGHKDPGARGHVAAKLPGVCDSSCVLEALQASLCLSWAQTSSHIPGDPGRNAEPQAPPRPADPESAF